MTSTDPEALRRLLAEMRAIHTSLDDRGAGVCILHLEAAIAALEISLLRLPRQPPARA